MNKFILPMSIAIASSVNAEVNLNQSTLGRLVAPSTVSNHWNNYQISIRNDGVNPIELNDETFSFVTPTQLYSAPWGVQGAGLNLEAGNAENEGYRNVVRFNSYSGSSVLLAPGNKITMTFGYGGILNQEVVESSFQLSVEDEVSDNNKPSVTLTKPNTNITIKEGGNYTLAAIASDIDNDLEGVRFFVNNSQVADVKRAPFTTPISNIDVGTYPVYVHAYDEKGNVTQSLTQIITVEADKGTAPVVEVVAPIAEQEIVLGDSVVISANVSDIDGDLEGVEFYIDGQKVETLTKAPFVYQFTPTSEGLYSFHVVAFDGKENRTESKVYALKVVEPIIETHPPVVSLLSPKGGIETIVGEVITLIANASDKDNDLKEVRFYSDNQLFKSLSSSPYTATFTAIEGESVLFAEAVDKEGNITRSSSIKITASKLNESDEGAGCDLPFYANGEQYNSGDRVQNNGSIYVCKQFGWCGQNAYEPGVAWNGNEYWKDAWDVEGTCEATENIAPTISLLMPEVFADTSFEFSASASDDGEVIRVDYYLNSALVGSSEEAPFILAHQGLPEGNYQLFAVATDDEGAQTRTAAENLTVNKSFNGNRLTLTFPEFSHKDLLNPPSELSTQELTGELYCPSTEERIKIRGSWGETVYTDELKECQYQLILDEVSGYLPRFSPWLVDFTKNEEREVSIDALYRAPIKTDALFPLGDVNVDLFAEGVYQARALAQGDNIIFVGSSGIKLDHDPLGSVIYAIELDPQTKQPIGTYIVAEGEEPHGVAYRDNTLYYATVGALYKISNISETFKHRPKAEKIFTYPADGTKVPIPPETHWKARWQHQKHPIKFNTVDLSDNKLYTAIGNPCNICETPDEELYGTIIAIDLDTGDYEIMARGIRNAVGFDWHPKTGEIWFSDNNRQQFINPGEINRISTPGEQHFGFPYFFGKKVRGLLDEEMANWKENLLYTNIIPPNSILPEVDYSIIKPSDYSPAAFNVFSSNAPLGVQFWDAYSKEDELQYLVYATHANGSTEYPGLELRMVTIENGTKVIHERPLVTGWMRDRSSVQTYQCLTDACIGRPVEFLELEDGSMLVSDDKASVLYRLTLNPSGANVKQVSFSVPSEAPDRSISDELISGALIHQNGHESKFHMAWGARDMDIDGLENGTYNVRLNDVGDYIPEIREYEIIISDSNPSENIILAYKEKPVDLVGMATITAPSKPVNISVDNIDVLIINTETQEEVTRTLVWGESLSEELKYGSYEIQYPYFNNYLPSPSAQTVIINESNLEHKLTFDYEAFNDGADLINKNCASCHGAGENGGVSEFFDNANKASVWGNAGYDALLDKIMSMNVSGHCDRTCAEEIADYLYDDVWNDYLNATDSFGNRQVRLLTAYEYSNSIKDLFNITIDKNKLPKDKYEREFIFAGQANHGVILPEDMKQYHSMAVDIADRLDLESIGYSENINATDFVNQIGLKVYRRPLDSAETSRFVSFLSQYDARDLVAAMLLSPNYLYRSELGSWNSDESAYELSQYELATALSYSFLGTTPSTSLLIKASKGELDTDTQIADQVASMMQSEKGIKRFTDFIGYYINTKVEELPEKPGLTPDVVNAMVQEQAEFIRYFLTEGEGTLTELFNPNFTFVNETLAKHYGIDGVVSDEFEKVGSKEGQRGGLLHHGLTQVINSDYAATSLVKRGLMIRQNLLCRTIGVPVDVDPDSIELPDTAITTRERWDTINGEFASAGQCWECHQFMNDTGASLENYSQTGEWRTEEVAYNEPGTVLPIDASGPLRDNTGMNVILEFENARDISAHFPTNTTVMQCLADSYFRYAMGVEADAESTAGIQDMTQELKESGSIHEMLKTLATSHMFKFKKDDE